MICDYSNQNPDYGYLQYCGKMGLTLGNLSKAFQVEHSEGAAKIFEKSLNLAKNEEKPCSTCLKPFFFSGYLIGIRKSDFEYPFQKVLPN